MSPPEPGPLSIARVEAVVCRAPIDEPIVTSFGTIPERAGLFVRLEDADGVAGWGEVFGNFPAHGAENRCHLVRDYLAPIVTDEAWVSPAAAYEAMTRRTHVMALQGGEPGPFAQAIAGLDNAIWDLAARRAGVPLWRLLGGERDAVPTYASGLNSSNFEGIVEAKLAEGYRAFKIKIGFGRETDTGNLARMREIVGDLRVMTDVNQGWDMATAVQEMPHLAEFDLGWIEEPLPADRPLAEWREIKAASPAPLAAGENLRGDADFDAMIEAKVLDVVQPDMCKWGGVTGCLPLAKRIVAAGLTYCPHFLAGIVGLMSSAHLLAAAGGHGLLEVDANPNPLREVLAGGLPPIEDGIMTLPAGPGIGVEPDADLLKDFRVEL